MAAERGGAPPHVLYLQQQHEDEMARRIRAKPHDYVVPRVGREYQAALPFLRSVGAAPATKLAPWNRPIESDSLLCMHAPPRAASQAAAVDALLEEVSSAGSCRLLCIPPPPPPKNPAPPPFPPPLDQIPPLPLSPLSSLRVLPPRTPPRPAPPAAAVAPPVKRGALLPSPLSRPPPPPLPQTHTHCSVSSFL